jgi:hypothetical protein
VEEVVQMESQEAKTALGEEAKDRSEAGAFHVITSDNSGVRFSKVYRIKAVIRSIVVDALKVMDDMWMDCQDSPRLAENYHLLRHYLEYLKRFCEGKV